MATTLLTRPASTAAHLGIIRLHPATPSASPAQELALLTEQLDRVHQVMNDFQRTAAELDVQAQAEDLRNDPTAALHDRAYARQMRLCVVRLAGALLA